MSFAYHNLVHHAFPPTACGLAQYDLILCRNVMIYFETAIIRRLAEKFHDCLAEGGWLAVGPSEPSVGLFGRFQAINVPGAVVYRKAFRRSARPESPTPKKDDSPRPGGGVTTATATPRRNASQTNGTKSRRSTLPTPGAPRKTTPPPTLAMARAQLDRGDSEGALASCRRLISADRLNPLAHFYFALAAEQQTAGRETEQALRRAIHLDRDFILAHYHLGLVLQRRNERPAARSSFRNALALLARRDAAEVFADADGLTVGALRRLADMHLEALDRP